MNRSMESAALLCAAKAASTRSDSLVTVGVLSLKYRRLKSMEKAINKDLCFHR